MIEGRDARKVLQKGSFVCGRTCILPSSTIPFSTVRGNIVLRSILVPSVGIRRYFETVPTVEFIQYRSGLQHCFWKSTYGKLKNLFLGVLIVHQAYLEKINPLEAQDTTFYTKTKFVYLPGTLSTYDTCLPFRVWCGNLWTCLPFRVWCGEFLVMNRVAAKSMAPDLADHQKE